MLGKSFRHYQGSHDYGIDWLGAHPVLGWISGCALGVSVCWLGPPLPGKLTPLHFDHQGGLMEQSYASLQRSRQS
ncbi:hypothetical protein SynROS8604_02934 [Synechococcus sp. ROS8604]|nr:hypothetical protein SynROS8604_02934 [Synechococcus sp. ROS8604]